MSSEVQAKCTKPATRAASGLPASRCFSQYSIALTSWLVSASIALTCAASSSENESIRPSSWRWVSAEKGLISVIAASAASASSQRISIAMRLRKSAASLKQVRSGGDFAAVARAESQDSGSAQNGGDLGFFPKGQMTPAFEEAAFNTKAGAISAVVETPFGFHIIKVHERRGPRMAPLTEVSGQIKNFLEQGQREQKLQRFVEQVKTRSKIEILV